MWKFSQGKYLVSIFFSDFRAYSEVGATVLKKQASKTALVRSALSDKPLLAPSLIPATARSTLQARSLSVAYGSLDKLPTKVGCIFRSTTDKS
jgi:hypothetical protein